MIDAGKLDKRITLQKKTIARASDGSETITYTDVATVWAEYVVKTGREFYAAQKINAEVTALFRLRYRSNMDTRYRVDYKGRYFDILYIDDTLRLQNEMMFACKEVV